MDRRLARAGLDEAIVLERRTATRVVRPEVEEAANTQVATDLEKARETLARAAAWRASGKPPVQL